MGKHDVESVDDRIKSESKKITDVVKELTSIFERKNGVKFRCHKSDVNLAHRLAKRAEEKLENE